MAGKGCIPSFGWGCGTLILGFFLIIILINVFQENQNPPPIVISQPPPPKIPSPPADHLKEAERLLRAWRLDGIGDGKGGSVGEFADKILFGEQLNKLKKIADHLNAIDKKDANYTKAQKTIKELRKKCASEIEKMYLEEGIDVYIRVSGNKNEIIRFKHITFGRAFAYQMRKSLLIETMEYIGFKKVIFDNGFNYWTYDLSKK
jgi:hypothetical protein